MSRKLLVTWADHSQVYRVLHNISFEHFSQKDAKLKIPAIILTSLSAGLAFSVPSFPPSTAEFIPVIVGALNLVAGTFTSISSFHKTAENGEGHRLAAVSFSKLRRKIQEKLELHKDVSNEFVSNVREELDSLIETGPAILQEVVELFRKKHKNTCLHLPAIVELGVSASKRRKHFWEQTSESKHQHVIEIRPMEKEKKEEEEKNCQDDPSV